MRVKIAIFVMLSLLCVNSFSQNEVSTIEKAEALFIYNFSRHIGWPESSFTSDEFIIGVVSNKTVFNELV